MTTALDDYQRLKVRQTITNLLGPDSKAYYRVTVVSPRLRDLHLLVQCPRVLADKVVVKTQLIDRLADYVDGMKVRLVLIDPEVTITEEQKRFRYLAIELPHPTN